MNKQGMLIVVSGPSGVGKDTIVNLYLAQHPNTISSVSATTRPPREGEVEGEHYFFVTKDDFEQKIDHGEMLEYARYNHHYYGTPKKMVEKALAAGTNVVLVIEVQGAQKIQQLMPQALLVFIAPPSLHCLQKRLQSRGADSATAIEERLVTANVELEKAKHYDYIVQNSEVDKALAQFSTIVEAASCSPKHVPDLLKGVCSLC